VIFSFASEEAGDLAPTAEVMAAARRAAQAWSGSGPGPSV
jgi:hypothetical protein